MKYRLSDIAKIVNGQVYGIRTKEINFVTVDSRIFSPAENGLFVAIRGKHHDGHDYIEEISRKQISCFMVNQIPPNLLGYGNNYIVVKDTLAALQKWAAYHRSQFKYPVIGITGSNGKTILKEWMFQVLKDNYFIIRSPKSYNSQVGVPLSVLLMEEKHNLAIFEAGISFEGEMIKLQKIIEPTIGIFTNIGDAHQENFTSLKQKLEEKLKLFFDTETIIYSKDNQMIDSMLQSTRVFENKQLISWSKKYPANFSIERIDKKATTTHIAGTYNNKQYHFSIPFVDEASLENSFHLILLLLHLNFDASTINERLKHLFPVAMRLEMKKAINNSTIINDTYNSDINSLSIALDFLTLQHHHQ
ncbi:MAG TPA: bifunctional UDP-N-acetylmuramoyl-tripeptide:D-alanyl-D-alanine ligase/alanine racemase, partial [Bacteroidales bacterium]|nr:bifunctional UDP-N-acetylmuramoyl-tripeptide:D-alanyl-D-alanine ligase/alanine racemase [Bacteroidales bacterium]